MNNKMMEEIKENEIRILGKEAFTVSSGDVFDNITKPDKNEKKPSPKKGFLWLILIFLLLIVGLVWYFKSNKSEEQVVGMDETVSEGTVVPNDSKTILGTMVDSTSKGYTEIRDTVINDVPLELYIPYNAEVSLYVGKPNKEDKDIILITQAADIRRDNRKIVGSFVYKGELLAKGMSKAGFCAIINGKITISMAENSPLMEEAIEQDGYFFRQFPLVFKEELVENEVRGKYSRRALCERSGEIFVVKTVTNESMHDFAQALLDLGVDNAIYLVGSTAIGWAIDKEDRLMEFGQWKSMNSPYTNFIVWRRK